MKWSPQQDAAILKVHRWLEAGGKEPFLFDGFAGTGKTTLARHLATGLTGQVFFCAFTGKATYVLRSKGCPGASTIHSLIYKPCDKSKQRLNHLRDEMEQLRAELAAEMRADCVNDPPSQEQLGEWVSSHSLVRRKQQEIDAEVEGLKKPMFSLNTESSIRHAKLVVIDERSMVDDQMGDDLASFGVPLLLLGDPAQLPPVNGRPFLAGRAPDVLLTEIHRQARDNPIIDLATRVREGRGLELGEFGDSRVVELGDCYPEMYSEHDQVLCGRENRPKNGDPVWRPNVNRRMRSLLGRTDPHPVPGDKVVCLRNDHEEGLLNGGLWRVRDSLFLGEEVSLTIESDDGMGEGTKEVLAHSAPFRCEQVPFWKLKDAQHFDYGYCMTVHKAQGSQWGSVMIFDQSRIFREDAHKWLYTAITRAADRVTVIRC